MSSQREKSYLGVTSLKDPTGLDGPARTGSYIVKGSLGSQGVYSEAQPSWDRSWCLLHSLADPVISPLWETVGLYFKNDLYVFATA